MYAYPSEIEAWRASRKVVPEPAPAKPLWKIPAFALTLALCLVMVGNGVRPVSAQQRGSAKAARQVWVTRTSDNPLDVSFDGRYFASIDWRTGDLAVRDLKTGSERLLTKNGGQQEVETAMFSPDGRQVAYYWDTWKEPAKNEVFVIPAAGGAPRRLWSSEGTKDDVWPLGWSPDGKQLLVSRSLPDHHSQLALLSIQDGSIHGLKSFEWQSFNASFSPDGKLIAYDAPRGGTSGARDILVLEADGSRETAVAQSGNSPVWSPDGSRILFQSGRTGRNALWSIPLVNGKPARRS